MGSWRDAGQHCLREKMLITILLVDDHELVRTGIRRILESCEDFEVIGEASSGEEALELVAKHMPDIVLMDVNMPGIGGIETTQRITHIYPDVKVIVVTVLSDSPFPHQLHDAGAMGYLTKGCPAEDMINAIKRVSKGQPYISADVAHRMSLASLNGVNGESPFSTLSQREMQVMMMIVEGQKTQDIADSLFLSPKTVSTYRQRLYAKLNVETDVELAHMAIRYGLMGIKTA